MSSEVCVVLGEVALLGVGSPLLNVLARLDWMSSVEVVGALTVFTCLDESHAVNCVSFSENFVVCELVLGRALVDLFGDGRDADVFLCGHVRFSFFRNLLVVNLVGLSSLLSSLLCDHNFLRRIEVVSGLKLGLGFVDQVLGEGRRRELLVLASLHALPNDLASSTHWVALLGTAHSRHIRRHAVRGKVSCGWFGLFSRLAESGDFELLKWNVDIDFFLHVSLVNVV